MKIKSISAPALKPTLFSPLPTTATEVPNLAKEAKRLNNLEKGKAADEKYLGEEQNLEARVREIERVNRDRDLGCFSPDPFYPDDDLPF